MQCYFKDQHTRPGGVRFALPDAVGICQHCGVAVCEEHAQKDDYPGALLLCYECARLQPRNDRTILQTKRIKQPELS